MHHLKDLEGPEHVWQAAGHGIRVDFPPLVGAQQTRARSNLPRQLTSFVGRERELEELRRLLESTPLLTLTGTGGVGKTRLALRLADATLADYCRSACGRQCDASFSKIPGLLERALLQ
jgi:hypothetical protein